MRGLFDMIYGIGTNLYGCGGSKLNKAWNNNQDWRDFMKLYVARHGQTVWNAKNKVCGITDAELTPKGIEQAKELAKSAAEKEVDIILTSPLSRAAKTGRIVSGYCNIPMYIEDRLAEQNYGIYEGVDRKNEEFLNNKRNFAYRYPQGESMMQVACRIYSLLDEIREKYNGKKVLLISHGGVCRIINTYFKDMTNDEFFNYTLKNAQIEEYVYESRESG